MYLFITMTSLAFVWGIHQWPVNSLHKGPVTREMFPFDAVIMSCKDISTGWKLLNGFCVSGMLQAQSNGEIASLSYDLFWTLMSLYRAVNDRLILKIGKWSDTTAISTQLSYRHDYWWKYDIHTDSNISGSCVLGNQWKKPIVVQNIHKFFCQIMRFRMIQVTITVTHQIYQFIFHR